MASGQALAFKAKAAREAARAWGEGASKVPRRLHPLTIESKLLGREGIGGAISGAKEAGGP